MRCRRFRINYILLYAIAVMSSGCASPTVRVEKMILAIERLKVPVTAKTLILSDVTGGEQSNVLASRLNETVKIDNQNFREALFKTLQNAGIFRDVLVSGNGDYALTAEIASQSTNRVGFIEATAQLLVNYTLIGKVTNNEVWREHIFSQSTAEGDYSFFFGAAGSFESAAQKANEGAVKENLSQFISKLSSFFINSMEK